MKHIPAIEVRRKTLHILIGVGMVVLLHYHFIDTFGVFLILCVGVIMSFVLAKWEVPILFNLLKLFERKNIHPGKGAITFFVGCILALKLFPENVAFASIMVLSFGDGISPLIGMAFGKTKTTLSSKKLFEGTLVGILLSTISASLFVGIPLALISSTVAMLLEASEVKFNNKILSDNILVPLSAGTTILLVARYFPFLF